MKYKNKDGISLNYTNDDIHARLVKEVILEAIDILDEGRHYDCKEFLKKNFDIENKSERSDEWRIEQFNRNRLLKDQVKTIEEMEKVVWKDE